MLTAARLLDDPKLPLRDALQTPEAVADLLARYAVPALIPGRELGGAAVLYFKYAPGRKCVGLYALQLRGEPQQRPRWATVTLAKDDRLEGIHSSSYGGRTDQAVYVPEHRCLVESFPSDWELPTLGLALDPAAVARLAADGRAARADPSPHLLPTVEVLRHRPHDSFVLRYQGVAWADGTREMVGKLYRAGPMAAELGRKLAMLHSRAAARGFAVPKPLAVVDRLNLLLMERVRGASVKDLIEADDAPSSAERATRAAARALAALHSLPFASDERRSLATELNRLRKRAGWLALVAPLLAEQVTRLIGRLSARLAAAPDARICLIHADYKPSQLLVDGEHTALVDFDRTCLGDPAIDVGAFMAQCDKEALATGRDQLRQLADSFLDDYASYAGEVDEGLRHRARLMRVLALVRLAVRTFQYAPLAYARDGTSARSELLLHEAATCLAELDR